MHYANLTLRWGILVSAIRFLSAIVSLACIQTAIAQEPLPFDKIKNIVVIYAENRSFDHLYGFFPGANGIAQATPESKTQIDHNGEPLPYLTIFGPDRKPDPRFPRMPNGPFQIDAPPINVPPDRVVLNPVHAYYQNIDQINGGKNN